MTIKNKKVVVAMSGGVDSSVVAGMLKEKGYEVIGITLQLYNSKQEIKSKTCCSGIDIYDAKEVARKLDISHYVLNYQENFKKTVINNFIDSYKNGETPIPCVQCNQHIKFDDLLLTAKGLGAEFLATGHYIRKKKINNAVNNINIKEMSKSFGFKTFYSINDEKNLKQNIKKFLSSKNLSFLEVKVANNKIKNLPRPTNLIKIKDQFIKK